jgi:hypothetical protein
VKIKNFRNHFYLAFGHGITSLLVKTYDIQPPTLNRVVQCNFSKHDLDLYCANSVNPFLALIMNIVLVVIAFMKY